MIPLLAIKKAVQLGGAVVLGMVVGQGWYDVTESVFGRIERRSLAGEVDAVRYVPDDEDVAGRLAETEAFLEDEEAKT